MSTYAQIVNLTMTAYTVFVRHVLAGVLLAIGPWLVGTALALLARDLRGWLGYAVSLGYAFVVVVYLAAVLRHLSAQRASLWRAFKVGWGEVRLAMFGLILGLMFTFAAIVYTMVFAMFSLTSWYIYVPAYVVFLALVLRLVLVAPLVVLEGKTAMQAADRSWHLTVHHMTVIFISGVLVCLPIGYALPLGLTVLEMGSSQAGSNLMMLASVAVHFVGWFMAGVFAFCVYKHLIPSCTNNDL